MPQRKVEAAKHPVPSGPVARKRWVFRVILLLVPALLLVVLEGALRIGGYGVPTTFFVKTRAGDGYVTNQKFAWQFFTKRTTSRPVYHKLPLHKTPNKIRIFVLGESAAMGTPDPAFAFCRMLQLFLERHFPDKKVEIVNAAMRGIDSHVIRRIAKECANYDPDLFIVYAGNNDVIGLHGPEPGASRLSQWLPLIRASHAIKASRIGQLVRAIFGRDKPGEEQTMEYFRSKRLRASDPLRQLVYRNFRANLEDICRVSKAPVVLSTVPVNLKDFPPLASLHRPDLSAAQRTEWNAAYLRGELTNALRLDDEYAELHFRIAEGSGTRESFQRARDLDALQFRTDRRMNDIIREVGKKFHLVDAERRLAEADGGVPGSKTFRDHVHPTFTGDFLLATALLPEVLRALEGRPTVAQNQPSEKDAVALLGYTEWHEAQMANAMVRLTAGPPFHDQLNYRARQAASESAAQQRLAQLGQTELQHSLEIARAALDRKPDDWQLRFNYASMCQAMGQPGLAIEHLQFIVRMFPDTAALRIQLAEALRQVGQTEAAKFELREAAKLDPSNPRLNR